MGRLRSGSDYVRRRTPSLVVPVVDVVSFPDPTTHTRKCSGDTEALSWSCAPSHDHTCSNTNLCKLSSVLSQPRIYANAPRPFPRVRSGVWEQDYDKCRECEGQSVLLMHDSRVESTSFLDRPIILV